MPALIEEKETDKINWHFYMHQKKLFKTGVILWENARCVLEISTEKPEKTANFQKVYKRLWAVLSN